MDIRDATEADFTAITAIYAWNVRNGTGTFALEPPSQDEMATSFRSIAAMRLPYIVAVEGETILGYAYAAPFRTRPAYRYGVEDSLYLAPEAVGKGVGKALLLRLIQTCTERGLYTMTAVIGDSGNAASIGVHRSCGFTQTGTLPNAGFKFGRWLDVVFMTRQLRALDAVPQGEGWAD
jgi:phosphinothricin acetyltransferase